MKKKDARVYDIDGIKCWTTGGASLKTKYHRSTISRWAEESMQDRLDFPVVYRVVKGRKKLFIPIDKYLEWLGYKYQN